MTSNDVASGEQTPPVAGCLVCERLRDPDRRCVIETETFTTYVSPQYPWAVMLTTNRHECAGPWELTEDEASELGRLIRQLTGAIRASGSDLVYVLNFGEDIPLPHYHVGFFTRWEPISVAAHQAIYARTQETPPKASDTDEFVAAVREQLSR